MHIAIDARLYGLEHAGIGRYTQNLIEKLQQLDSTHQWTVILNAKTKLNSLPKNWQQVQVNARHYTLKEQWQMSRLLSQLKPDLVHYTHFNRPWFDWTGSVVTIHDILWHDQIGFSATTLPAPAYLIKYLGYRLIINRAIHQAEMVIVPTEQVKQRLLTEFKLKPAKVKVTYEAASDIYRTWSKNVSKQVLPKYKLKPPFYIYTGSLYPHKNVDSAVSALEFLPSEFQLVIVSARNAFSDKFKAKVRQSKFGKRVKFLGYVPDQDLVGLYQAAVALIQPSQSEGFGLTGLEAMEAGLPVVATQMPIFEEIYRSSALLVDTKQPKQIAQAITRLSGKSKFRQDLIKKGKANAKRFSWSKMAEQTLNIYQQVLDK